MHATDDTTAATAPESRIAVRAPWQAPKVIVAEQVRDTKAGNAGTVFETTSLSGTRSS